MKNKLIITFLGLLLIVNIYEIYDYNQLKTKYNKIEEEKLTKQVLSYEDNINKEYGYTKEELYKQNIVQKENKVKLQNQIKENEEKIKALEKQKNVLSKKYKSLQENNKTFIIKGIMKINQYSIGYPTGCESAALTILLNYWNENVTIEEVAGLLKKGDAPHYENNVRYGGNPYIEFIGNPTDPNSYGVYDKPIEEIANKLKPEIINGRGMSLNEVLQIVKQNRPVIVWNTMDLKVPYISDTWIYKPTGERINWLSSLHAIVIIGYTETNVIVSDSLTGTIRYFDKNIFENRYNAFGKRALYY